jgi:tripartite-type tricarboxylate transporter receptor subunit TctC
MQRRELLMAALGTVPALAMAQPAGEYPRPGATIRYVVPFPPGGLTDVMARLVAQQLSERWKVSVVVDNKPGNGGQIGADASPSRRRTATPCSPSRSRTPRTSPCSRRRRTTSCAT